MSTAHGDAGRPGEPRKLDRLPRELILHILSFLDADDVIVLERVSRRLQPLCRENESWRVRCFDQSAFLRCYNERRRRDALPGLGDGGKTGNGGSGERIRLMADWDPSYAHEPTNWFEEYVQRHGRVSVNWYEEPRPRDGCYRFNDSVLVEARGLALYRPRPSAETGGVVALAPLDDGSVCLWDVSGSRRRKGAIMATSKAGLLFGDRSDSCRLNRSSLIDAGVTECVSVDNFANTAFFGVQSQLVGVDLTTLSVVSRSFFPWSVTTLSAAWPGVPLSVGTTCGLHLYDWRQATRLPAEGSRTDKLDDLSSLMRKLSDPAFDMNSMYAAQEPAPPCAPLPQPTPLSILHAARDGTDASAGGAASDSIFVSGRFASIVHYDRRRFGAVRGALHSGGTVCSMTAAPRRPSKTDGGGAAEQDGDDGGGGSGTTIVGCGDYRGRGSLEMYAMGPAPAPRLLSATHNRSTASSARMLSVVNHGARLAVSDAAGGVTWFERDGRTVVRRLRLGAIATPRNSAALSATAADDLDDSAGGAVPTQAYGATSSGEVARKLVPVAAPDAADPNASHAGHGVVDSDLLLWTGERLGTLSFSTADSFDADSFVEPPPDLASADARLRLDMERRYLLRMRHSLESHARELRHMANLGRRLG